MTPEDDRRNVCQHGRLPILRFVRMKRMSWLVSLAAACSSSVAWSQEGFAALLAKDSLSFSLPKGFAAVAVVANPDVQYQFAMKSSVVKAEIRYAIFPSSNNAQFAEMFLQTICLNVSGGKTCNIRPFPQPAVRTEFGADGGFTSMTGLESQFGKGYKYCMANLIHKNDVADVVTFFLFDDMKVLQSLIAQEDVFHALRFK